jgi:hypothetical protein
LFDQLKHLGLRCIRKDGISDDVIKSLIQIRKWQISHAARIEKERMTIVEKPMRLWVVSLTLLD